MTEQLEKILQSSDYVKSKFPKNFSPTIALILEKNFDVLSDFKILDEINFENAFSKVKNNLKNPARILLAKCKDKDVLIYQGRYHYYDGVSMRDIGHVIYTLRSLGINKIISIEEVGYLNPRFECGELALIYDHINLMGDNPLIGKNDSDLGLRFPDMSNAYDRDLFNIAYRLFQEQMIRVNESVFLGIIGPQSETDAEARFYRDIGADILGYSLVPENITSIHAGIKFIGIGLITRELVADKMMEDKRSERQKNSDQKNCRKIAEKVLRKLLPNILSKI